MFAYVLLAKKTLERFVKEGKAASPKEKTLPNLLRKKAGVFVALRKGERLIGVFGTYLPNKKNIAEEIIYNTVAAASGALMNEPITEKELPKVKCVVYVLSEPRSVSKPKKELDPKVYGMIVCSAENPLKCGLLLPNLEGVDTIEQQLALCADKAQVDLEMEEFRLFRFKVKKYEER